MFGKFPSLGFVIVSALALGFPSKAETLKGVNLAGPAFAATKIPGLYGRDFIYPTEAEIEYFVKKKMNVFRVSILWERLQPRLNGQFDPDELSRLTTFVQTAHKHGGSVLIDIHNYGAYRGVLIGDDPVAIASFGDLWQRLAKVFGQDAQVLFGLMNEPKLQQAGRWQGAVQQAINSIRGAGATNKILVPGIGWDGAHNFVDISATSLGALSDPEDRLVYEVHEYFDANSSGTSDTCVSPDEAVRRFTSFTDWLRAGKRHGFLGEFGASRRAECLAALDLVLSYLQANSDAWLGWTYWAAGPRWGEYMFTLEPAAGGDRPQMTILEKHLP
jgi:endoglucanase